MEVTVKIEVSGNIMRLSDPDSDFYMMTRPPEGVSYFSDEEIGKHIAIYLDWHRKYLEASVDRGIQPL